MVTAFKNPPSKPTCTLVKSATGDANARAAKSAKRSKAIPRPKPDAQIISSAIFPLGSEATVRKIRPIRAEIILSKPFVVPNDAEQIPPQGENFDRAGANARTGNLLHVPPKYASASNFEKMRIATKATSLLRSLQLFGRSRSGSFEICQARAMRLRGYNCNLFFGRRCIGGRREESAWGLREFAREVRPFGLQIGGSPGV